MIELKIFSLCILAGIIIGGVVGYVLAIKEAKSQMEENDKFGGF